MFEAADAVVEGLRACADCLRVEFVEDGEAGGEEDAFGPEIAEGFAEFFYPLVEARAEFFEPRFLTGSAAERVAFAADDEFSLGHVRKNMGDVLSGGERGRTEIASCSRRRRSASII